MIIVLDPGHGSELYEGASYNGFVEKDIDLAVANVIKDRLEKYDGVKVYLTRDKDISVGLKERCDFAKAVNADYFFSIHFNSSTTHSLFGSEVWLSSKSKYYNKIYPIANELINGFHQIGLADRGIKTKLGKDNQDYYAVIKYSSQYDIPSCIIEHCYLDNIKDTIFLNNTSAMNYANSLTIFGTNDADAIARALNLKSSILGVDYSNYKAIKINRKNLIKPDTTAPDKVELSLTSYDSNSSMVSFNIHAKDSNGYIQYYQYSIDGGQTYSDLILWPKKSPNESYEDCMFSVNANLNTELNVLVVVYNGYDLSNISNVVHIDKTLYSNPIDNKLFTGTLRQNASVLSVPYFISLFTEGSIFAVLLYLCLKKYFNIKNKRK